MKSMKKSLKGVNDLQLCTSMDAAMKIKRKNEMLRLAGGRENFKKIGESLKDIALADTTNLEAVWEYAEFANSQNMFNDALQYYTVCMNIAERNTYKCMILQRIGNLQQRQNHFSEAESALISSMGIAQLLWSQDSTNYRTYIADTQNNLAHLYAKMRDFGKTIYPATIYRVLDFLTSNGLVHRIDALNAYIACTKNHANHPSLLFICSNCSKTAEINDPDLCCSIYQNLVKLGMSANSPCIEVKGQCENCAVTKNNSNID